MSKQAPIWRGRTSAALLTSVVSAGALTLAFAGAPANAEPSTTVDALAGRVRRAVANEQELLVDPGWFTELSAKHPRVTHVAAEGEDVAAVDRREERPDLRLAATQGARDRPAADADTGLCAARRSVRPHPSLS